MIPYRLCFPGTTICVLFFIAGFSLFCFSCRTSIPAPEPEDEIAAAVPDSGIEPSAPDHKEPEIPKWIEPRPEFRAVWIATVANIDWPSSPGLSAEQQKAEMIKILDRAAALHFNAVILQVRPAADALYHSLYEPWSYYLTGKMGQPPLPAYDPLEFTILEAHKRGLELHAWFNPYRALHPTNRSEISPDHISITNPGYVHQYGDFLWMDPGIPEVREHTINVIMDVVERYDIDGIHFDDYFYPYPSYADGADFPDEISWQRALENGISITRSDWRRKNVNELVKELSERIKLSKPHVKFGISPFGIWRPGYPENTTGFDAYSQLYADARLWLREGWVDYFTPQLYYRMDQIPQPFPVMLQWWVEQNTHGRHMWPGLFTSRLRTLNITWPVEEISGQVYTSRGFPGVTGMVHFSMRTFLENSGNINRKLAAGPHARTSVIPASPWLDNHKPAPPIIGISDYDDYWTLHLQPGKPADHIRWFVVRKKYPEAWETDVVPVSRIETVYYGGKALIRPELIAVTAISRTGIESNAAISEISSKTAHHQDGTKMPGIDIIPRASWTDTSPSGIRANAIRINALPGDTIRFRDLTIIYDDVIHSAIPPGGVISGDGVDEVKTRMHSESTSARISLYRNGVNEHVSFQKTESLNWYGYHIGLLDIQSSNKAAQLEIATVSSLPVNRAAALTTGNAANRLRVPHRITRVTLHHTGSTSILTKEDDPADRLQGLLDWGKADRNWWDVPYHYFIDLDGNIYEGRNPQYAGETNTIYDPRGHLLISVMGNYNLQKPNERQITAIIDLMATAIRAYDLTVQDISGHKDLADTSCPGSYLSSLLESESFIQMIEDKLNAITDP